MGILLKSQYVIKHATAEDKLALSVSSTKVYIGPYIETVFKKRISGTDLRNPELVDLNNPEEQKGGMEFLPYDRLKAGIKLQTLKNSPTPSINKPTPNNYSSGAFTRTFFLDNRTKIFIETTPNLTPTIDTNIYSLYTITWSLSPTLGPKINKKTVTRLKKLGSIKINPYDHIKQFDGDE